MATVALSSPTTSARAPVCTSHLSAAAAIQRSSFRPRSGAALATGAPGHRSSSRRRLVNVQAFHSDTKIHDWRVQQMVDLTRSYLIDFLTHNKAELAATLFDDEVVHKDVVWDPTHPTVGIAGMKHYLHDLKTAFPDWWVEVDEVATVDTNSLMVTYKGGATNLGEYHHHKPSHHANVFEGCNLFRFNHDRSRIKEILVYRSAFAEDRNEMGERQLAEEGGFRELRLRRLV